MTVNYPASWGRNVSVLAKRMTSENYWYSFGCGYPSPGFRSWSLDGERGRVTFAMDYQTPGHYEIHALVRHPGCSGPSVEFEGALTVTAGARDTNGPELPGGMIDIFHNPNTGVAPNDFWLNTYGWDMDGFAYAGTVDWGDGTAPAQLTKRPLSECSDSGDWPQPDVGYGDSSVDHSYAPGTYTLTLTIYSEDCSGQERQVGKVTRQFTYSG